MAHSTTEQSDVIQSVIAVLEGRIEESMITPFARNIFEPFLNVVADPNTPITSFDPSSITAKARQFMRDSSDQILAQGAILFLAAICLHDFVTQNYTGPPTKTMLILGEMSEERQKAIHEYSNLKLRLDGEDVYEHSHHPLSLLFVKSLLLRTDLDFSHCKSLAYWTMRYARVHQDLLEVNSATLKSVIDEIIPIAIAQYGTPNTVDSSSVGDGPIPPSHDHRLASHVYLEAAHVYHGYWSYKLIDECLDHAKASLGVAVELTGVMGKRTRWQKTEQAQLVIKVTQSEARIQELVKESETTVARDDVLFDNLPHNLVLDSDVLLETMSLSPSPDAPLVESILGVEEQSLLLALHENVKKTTSGHITRDEEMLAYIHRLLQESKKDAPARVNPQSTRSWALECSALYHRSVLECREKHTQDRALQQLEELSALYDRLHAPTTVASVAELSDAKELADFNPADVRRVRMAHVWISNYPPIWELKQGIAATFQTIGLHKSALDLFLSIGSYDGVIESAMLLGKITQAEELIRQQLSLRPNQPKLLCLLADCTRDIQYYEQAWETSNHTYPRAQRSLANFKMNRGLHGEAIPHFQLALDINPVFPSEWYAMGWCAMQVKDFSIAAQAFSRTVAFDPEYANAWNNLAAAHLNVKNKQAGFSALEQAIKFKNDSWKLWENYMVTAMDLREFGKAISAMEKVVTLKANLNTQGEKEARNEAEEKSGEAGKQIIDSEILSILCTVVVDKAKSDGPDIFLVQRLLQLLNTTLQHVVNHPLVYACLSRVYEVKGDLDKSILMREKQVRFLQDATSRWSEQLSTIQEVTAAEDELIQAYIRSNTRPNLMAAKFSLDTLLNKLRKLPIITDSMQGKQCIMQLEGLLERVRLATEQLNSTNTASSSSSAASSATSSMSIWR